MASTRNKNTYEDYHLEQKKNTVSNQYNVYSNSSYGKAYKTSIPEIGYTPSKMPSDLFSHNSIDIESELRGIGMTNLVNKYNKVVPEYKSIAFKPYFRYIPLIMPKPLVIENDQRPYPIPH